jgi:hypothetical protein
MLNIPINVWVVDSKTLVGARFIEIHIHDIMSPADVPLLVDLINSHFLETNNIQLEEAVQDIRAFFSSRQYVATVEKTLSDFNFVLAVNMLGHLTDPNLSLQVMENMEIKDIHMWEYDALPTLEYMLC